MCALFGRTMPWGWTEKLGSARGGTDMGCTGLDSSPLHRAAASLRTEIEALQRAIDACLNLLPAPDPCVSGVPLQASTPPDAVHYTNGLQAPKVCNSEHLMQMMLWRSGAGHLPS